MKIRLTLVAMLFSGVAAATCYPVRVPDGGTGACTWTAHSILFGEGNAAFNAITLPANAPLLGTSSADPHASTAFTLTDSTAIFSDTGTNPEFDWINGASNKASDIYSQTSNKFQRSAQVLKTAPSHAMEPITASFTNTSYCATATNLNIGDNAGDLTVVLAFNGQGGTPPGCCSGSGDLYLMAKNIAQEWGFTVFGGAPRFWYNNSFGAGTAFPVGPYDGTTHLIVGEHANGGTIKSSADGQALAGSQSASNTAIHSNAMLIGNGAIGSGSVVFPCHGDTIRPECNLDGKIGLLAIYEGTLLSNTQISNIWNGGALVTPSSLPGTPTHLYTFDEKSGAWVDTNGGSTYNCTAAGTTAPLHYVTGLLPAGTSTTVTQPIVTAQDGSGADTTKIDLGDPADVIGGRITAHADWFDFNMSGTRNGIVDVNGAEFSHIFLNTTVPSQVNPADPQVYATLCGTGLTCTISGSSQTHALTQQALLNTTMFSDVTAGAVSRGAGIFGIGSTPKWTTVAAPSTTNGYIKKNSSGDMVGSTGAAAGTGDPGTGNCQFVAVDAADASPTFGTISAGSNVTVTCSGYNVSVASTGGGGGASIQGNGGPIFSQTVTTTVASTTSPTTLTNTGAGSLTLAANFFNVGAELDVYADGTMANLLTPTGQIVFSLGGTAIADTGTFTQTTITGTGRWWFKARVTGRTTGSSGTVFSQGQFCYFTAANTQACVDIANTSTTTINTTGTLAADLKWTWGTNSGSDTISCTNLSLVRAANTGNNITNTAAGSEPSTPSTGDLNMPTNSFVLNRYNGTDWTSGGTFGPVFPLTFPPLVTSGVTTTLSAAISSSGATTLSATSNTGFPAANYMIIIDTEEMLVTNVSGATWTITRGFNGTTAATHSNGATITLENWDVKKNSGTAVNTFSQMTNGGIWFSNASGGTSTYSMAKRQINSHTSFREGFISACTGTSTDQGECGMIMLETSSSKVWVFHRTNSGSIREFRCTSFVGTCTQIGTTINVGGNGGTVFLRGDTVSTNITSYYSFDGQNWQQYNQTAKTTIFTTAPNEVGPYVANNTNTTFPTGMTLGSWVEQ